MPLKVVILSEAKNPRICFCCCLFLLPNPQNSIFQSIFLIMNIDEELQKANKEMNDAEDALAQTGFSVEQWMLIKNYVLSAILSNQLSMAKSMQEFGKSEQP
jgi:hypothetical protein